MEIRIFRIALEGVSFLFVLWCIINCDKIYQRFLERKRKIVIDSLMAGDRYIEEVNRITNYRR